MDSLNRKKYKQLRTSTAHTYNYYSSVNPSKATIMFIHGFPYTANIWRRHIGYFENLGFGCVAPDVLGFGGSDKPYSPQDYCPKAIAQSLIDILHEEDVERAVVIGHDWGCQVATRVVLYYPSQVLALILIAVPYYKPGAFDLEAVNEETEQLFGASIFGYWEVFMSEKKLLEKHIDSFFCLFYAKDPAMWKVVTTWGLYKKFFVGRGAVRKWLEDDQKCTVGDFVTDIERQDFMGNDWAAATQYYHCFSENHHWESEKDLLKEDYILTVPSLMVAAADDACAPLPLVKTTLEGFSDVQFVVMEGGHHFLLSDTDEFNNLAATFLRQKGIPP